MPRVESNQALVAAIPSVVSPPSKIFEPAAAVIMPIEVKLASL